MKKNINIKTIFVVLTILFGNTGLSEDKCKLYPKLSQEQCSELLSIQANYYKYNEEMKKIALTRANEIKLHLLSEEEKVKAIFAKIENNNVNNIPIKIINDVISYWKFYLNFTKEAKIELIKQSIGMKYDQNFEEVNTFIDDKSLFITDRLISTKTKSTVSDD